MMFSKGTELTFAYYDPYFGQLYKQTVTKSEIKNVLENVSDFAHPYSIINKKNMMLGKLSILESSLLDVNFPFVLKTVVTDIKHHNSDSSIDFADNVSPEHLIKYLAETPAMFDIMFYTTKSVAFENFLKQYNSNILAKIQNAKSCAIEMAKCSKYLLDVIRGFYQYYFGDSVGNSFNNIMVSGLQHDIKTLYSSLSLDNYLSSFPSSSLNDADLCIKEVKTYSEDGSVTQNFYRILLEDKASLTKGMHACLDKSTLADKKKVAQHTCEHFESMDANDFLNAHNAYYHYIDTRYQNYEEKCDDLSGLDDNLNPIAHVSSEL